MSLLDKGIVRPLTVGEHKIQLVHVSEGIASNGNEYVTISYKADDERTVRNRALFEMELGLFATNVSQQIGYEGDSLIELFQILAEVPFSIWVVVNTVDNKEYYNWYYRKPAEKHFSTVEDTDSLDL